MQNIKDLNKTEAVETFVPTEEELIIQTYVNRRVYELKEHRKNLKVEEKWKEADNEYVPHEMEFSTQGKRFETDQTEGYRTRLVPIGDGTDNWRSNNSAPTLLQKIQTAISIIIDNNPEAMFLALQKKFDKRSAIANSMWKRNWQISGGKEVMKLFVFNLVKYGWAAGRSFPKIIKYNKEVLVSYDTKNPEKNVYEDKEIVWFNDVAKQNLDPYRVWIDEQSKPYDIYSTNDCYYELDFSYDAAEVEFGQYPNWKFVKKDSKANSNDGEESEDDKDLRKDIVTIGFYENRLKDIFVIKAVKDDIILHTCPMPNDDGLLSVWHALWVLRTADRPDGISLWEIICQDKHTFDKWNNMGSDQLTLSIMKFGYYTGTTALTGDGKMNIVPGVAKQMVNGKIDWMEIPGPGKDWAEGLKMRQNSMDDSSGITPTMEGDVTGKTLGEIQLARESSLKRMKTPLENIAWAIEQDAYLSLSWMRQIYSTPEVKEFANEKDMMEFEKENDVSHDELFEKRDPNTEPVMGEDGQPMEAPVTGITATYLPQISLHLEDRQGQLFESKESRYFQIGKDIPVTHMEWRGMIKVIPKSLVGNSEIILKQTKQEMANLLIPLFAQDPALVKNAALQIIKVNEEDPTDWLPNIPGWNDEPVPPPTPPTPEPPKISISIPFADMPPEMQVQVAAMAGVKLPEPVPQEPELFVPQGGEKPVENTLGGANNGAEAPTVVPRGEISSPAPQAKSMLGGVGQLFNKNG